MTSFTSGPAVAGLALLAVLTGCAGSPSGTGGASHPTPPVLHLTGYSGGAGPAMAGEATTSGPAAPTGEPGSRYHVVGVLPTGPAAAPVYRFPGQVQLAAVRTLAAALGLTAAPVRHPYGWEVAGRAGAALRVRDDGAGQWSYLRGAPGPQCLPQVDLDAPAGLGATTMCSVAPLPAPGTPPAPPPPGPSVAVAQAQATAVLAAAGLSGDPVQAQAGAPLTIVWADPLVAGLPTVGLTTSVFVDRTGVRNAQGWLGTPVVGADYPLVTAAAALSSLDRMAHPLLPDAASGPTTSARAVPAIACPIRVGAVDPWCGGPVRITGARLGLALRYDGAAPILVPAWLFSVSGQQYPIVVTAVAPRYLADPVPAEPRPAGSSGSSDGATGSAPAPPPSMAPLPVPSVGAGHGVGPG